MLSVIAGHDERDMTSSPEAVPDYLQGLGATDLAGRTIGLPAEYFGDGLSDTVRKGIDKAIDALHDMGAKTIEVSLPSTSAAISAYYIVAMAEATSNLARFDGVRYGHRTENPEDLQELYTRSRMEGFGDEVKRRIMLGTFVLSAGYYDAYYKKAAQVRRLVRDEFLAALGKCDCLLAPVSPSVAWAIGSHIEDPLQNILMDAYSCPINLAALPSLALPVALSDKGEPVGLQLIGRPFAEAEILNIASALEGRLPSIGSPLQKA